jgi:beta-galactosidase
MPQLRDWEDPQVVGRNRRLMHVPLGAYPHATAALRGSRLDSPYVRLLNGAWKFTLAPAVDAVPDGFYAQNFDDSAWTSIPVPSNWQLPAVQLPGFKDNPIYANVHYTFEPNPPYPPEQNPTGCYRTRFTLEPAWAGRSVFLLFEGVDSNLTLWINGREVGYSQDSRLPAEFDVTPYLQAGENLIAARVMRYCDGSYLECQDFWRMSGIQRDVIVYSKPTVCLEDFAVRTLLDIDYQDARLEIEARITKNPAVVKYTVACRARCNYRIWPAHASKNSHCFPGNHSPRPAQVDGRDAGSLYPGADADRPAGPRGGLRKQSGGLPPDGN